MQSVKHNGKH